MTLLFVASYLWYSLKNVDVHIDSGRLGYGFLHVGLRSEVLCEGLLGSTEPLQLETQPDKGKVGRNNNKKYVT